MNAEQEERLKAKKQALQAELRVKGQIRSTIAPQWMPLLQELQAKQIQYNIDVLACMEQGDEVAWQAFLALPEMKTLGFAFEQLVYGRHYEVPFSNRVNAVFPDDSRSSRYTPPLPLVPEMEHQTLSIILPAAQQALGFTDNLLYLCNAYETTVISIQYSDLLQLNLEQYIGLDDWLITNAEIDWLIWLGWRGDCRWGTAKK
jgi:hypothetical protein